MATMAYREGFMFRDRRQLAQVCRVLTRGCEGEPLWTPNGPTPRAEALRDGSLVQDGAQRMLLEMAWMLWEGSRGPALGTMLQLLDRGQLHHVAALLMAMCDSPEAIDRWLRSHGAPIGDA